MWVQKYRPKSLEDYRGASKQKKKLKTHVEDWNGKPVLLHGQAGTGKTSLVEALANDLGFELVETNASDVRTKGQLKEELLEATRQASFFGGEKLILIDEVDGMSGRDRGGIRELKSIIEGSKFPVVMTANDAYNKKIRPLRNIAEEIKLDSVHTNSINAHLKWILDQEGIDYDEGAVKRIARLSGGQMRSAINDLESVALGREKLGKNDVKGLGQRDSEQEIFDTLKVVFKTSSADNARQASNNLDEDVDTLVQWIRENIPREYKKPEDVAEAYYWLSLADLFNGRIRKRMSWNLLKYVYDFSTIGVALSKDERYEGWTRYQYPSKLRVMGSSRASRNKLDNISSKLGGKLHISKDDAKNDLRLYSRILASNPNLAGQLDLDEDEVDFIMDF